MGTGSRQALALIDLDKPCHCFLAREFASSISLLQCDRFLLMPFGSGIAEAPIERAVNLGWGIAVGRESGVP